jgi:DNA mismatch repair ATPase MutS
MKAFLMFRDRDFDPQRALSVDERDFRARRDDPDSHLQSLLPWNEKALTQDLGLGILFNAMGLGDDFLGAVAKVAVMSGVTDLDTIRYRQQALQDCIEHEAIIIDMYRTAIEAIQGERKNYLTSFGRYPSGTLHRAVEVLQTFVGQLKKLRAVADQQAAQFKSEGFSTLFVMLQRELSDDYFATIEAHLKRLQFRQGVLISAELGRGNKSTNYLLREPPDVKRSWIMRLFAQKPPGYTFQLHPRDEGGARALSELRDRGVNLIANALAQSADHILSFFHMLRTELAFYVGCLNLRRQLLDMGEPICFPVPVPMGERRLSFSGLYDVGLALNTKHSVVGNELDVERRDIAIITGANTGGKSTFMRSVGLAQLMMQAGMFVPAESFSTNVCDGICTHYKREEDVSMESGKLDEELARMSETVDHLKPNTMVLFNESFAATNEREGSEIARQIVNALLEIRVEIIFVTHLYHFAREIFDEKMANAIFLRAERRKDGTRTFKLVQGEPLQTSYGKDLYNAVFGESDESPSRKDSVVTSSSS